MAHEGDFVVIPIGMAIMIVICCICGICLSIRSKSKTKERKLKYKEQEYQYMQGERERQREQERQRELEKQRERERHQAIMAQLSQLQQSRPYYPPPPPPVPAFEQVYPPPPQPPPIGIRSQVMAPQLPPPLPPSAMPSSSSSFSLPTAYPAVPRTTPGWNTDALQSKPQPGILITPKEDPTTKSVTINMAPAVVRPVSPPKRNARPLPSLRERANQKLNRSSSSSRTGSYASERDSRSGSRRRH